MRRVLAGAAVLVVAAAGIGGLVLFLQGRDEAGIETAAQGPGELEPDRGMRHLAPGSGDAEARLPGSEGYPTSGEHEPQLVSDDRRRLSVDEVLHALELGNVVITYPGRSAPAALRDLQEEVSGPFDAELAAAGQAVILAPGEALQGLAWRRRMTVARPSDARLRRFAEHWLGLGAPGR